MPLSEDYLALVRWHLGKFPAQPCPVCGNRQWQADEVVAPMIGSQPPTLSQPVNIGPGIMPAINLFCTTCYYIRQFALMPILRAAGRV